MLVQPEQFANCPATALNGAINDSQTTITVQDATGYPDAPFRIAVSDAETEADETAREYMLVTETSGATWTVERGIEGSSASSFETGDPVWHLATAESITQFRGDIPWLLNADDLAVWADDADLRARALRSPLFVPISLMADGLFQNDDWIDAIAANGIAANIVAADWNAMSRLAHPLSEERLARLWASETAFPAIMTSPHILDLIWSDQRITEGFWDGFNGSDWEGWDRVVLNDNGPVINFQLAAGPTGEGRAAQISFSASSGGAQAEWSHEVDVTHIDTLHFSTRLEVASGTQMRGLLDGNLLFSVNSNHGWVQRSFDVSGQAGVSLIRLNLLKSAGTGASTAEYSNIWLEGGEA